MKPREWQDDYYDGIDLIAPEEALSHVDTEDDEEYTELEGCVCYFCEPPEFPEEDDGEGLV